jgi:fructose-bisphosphate aldolase class II
VGSLLAATKARREAGKGNLFNSHMFDGSELSLEENIKVSTELLKECAALDIILEVEAGVVLTDVDRRVRRRLVDDELAAVPSHRDVASCGDSGISTSEGCGR